MALVLTDQLKNDLLRNDAEAWSLISALANKCAKRAAGSVNAAHLAEDAAHELLLLLYTHLLPRMEVGKPVEPFLNEVCRRILLAMRRQRREASICFDDDQVVWYMENQEQTEPMAKEMMIDAHAAKERIRRAVPESFWKETKKTGNERNQYQSGDRKFAELLKQERKRRKWTQKQMASYMGLKLPTYISYEHACVINPNPDIIDLLKSMQKETL